MWRFILKRFIVSLGVIFGSITLVFFLLHILPGDSARLIGGENITEEGLAELQAILGLDKPVGEQYLSYIGGILTGDLGHSFIDNQPVMSKILDHLPATLALTVASAIIAITVGIALGIISAVYQNKWVDVVVRIIGLFSVSMPTFWIGILLIMVFSLQLNWFPAMGSGSFSHLVLPAICLGFMGSGTITRMVRNSVLEVMNDQFVQTLRAKGLREGYIMFFHILRNALIPVITVMGILIGELLAGSVVTETVFARQGIGRVVVDAINQKDIPMIQGVILFVSIMYVVVNFLVDLSYAFIDPRVKNTSL